MNKSREQIKEIIIKDIKHKTIEGISCLQKEYGIGFSLAEEIYFECEELISARNLKKLINKKVKVLSQDRANLLLEETDQITNHQGALRMMIAYKIAKYLNKNNEHFILTGNLHSSYVAYELGINIVDTFKFNIHPEICHGVDYNYPYSLEFRVSTRSMDRVLDYIDNALFKDRLLRVSSVSHNGKRVILPGRRVLLLDKSLKDQIITVKDYKNIEHKCLDNEEVVSKNRDKLISIIILGHAYATVVNETFKRVNKDIESIENIINNEPQIIEKLCHYYDDENIEKCYLPEFKTDYINKLIKIVNPKNLLELVKLINAAHGTAVWENNQDILFKNKRIGINELIGSRDDVIDYLISNGYSKENALKILERVRKGQFNDEIKNELEGVSEPFISIISQTKYLFPKGHSIAMLYCAIYTEYLKENYPEDFFVTYMQSMLIMRPPWFYEDKEGKLFRYIEELKNAPINSIYGTKYDEAIKGAKFAILLNRLKLSYLWYEF